MERSRLVDAPSLPGASGNCTHPRTHSMHPDLSCYVCVVPSFFWFATSLAFLGLPWISKLIWVLSSMAAGLSLETGVEGQAVPGPLLSRGREAGLALRMELQL